jgi:DNA-binding NarL/FixJ family response regulator
LNVLLVDDHRLVREGLRAVLERAGVTVLGEAATGHDALKEARRLKPEVVLMDIGMPDLNGIDATKRLATELPSVKVLALSMHVGRRYVLGMLEAGAKGYLVKTAASEELLLALEALGRGETYLSPTIAQSVVAQALEGVPATRPNEERSLSVREREVLQLVAEGKSSKEISNMLQIAVPTVETHRRQIMEKLNLRTIAALTKYAIREGLTTSDP